MTEDIVKKYWRSLAARHDVDAFAVLDAAYREPQRGYHDWSHISDLLHKLDRFSHLATRPDLIAAAIFWHDAVYVTRDANGLSRSDAENVRASATLFERHALFDKVETAVVHEMIMATARHLEAKASRERYPGFAKDLDLFLDLDLSTLAAPWPDFEWNLEKIRFEYGWVPENVFCLGRLQMGESFAAQGARLYRREELRELWGEAALANLSRSLGELRAKLARLASPA